MDDQCWTDSFTMRQTSSTKEDEDDFLAKVRVFCPEGETYGLHLSQG